jgi:hypothetical protein
MDFMVSVEWAHRACLDGGVNGVVNGANLPLRCQTCGANVAEQIFCPPNSIYP